MGELVLYASQFSRAFVPFWLLEEIGVPFRTEFRDLRRREHKRPDYLALNPMGKVPTLTDDGVVVTETPAICLHLADRYSYGALAPRIEDAARGTYLRWMVFSTAVFEPGAYLPQASDEEASGVGWGRRTDMLATLEAALQPGPYLLGERFSAADVMLGGLMSIALFNKRFPETAAVGAYNALISARPAYQRALKHNGWG
jgi:glutathione S-transferase